MPYPIGSILNQVPGPPYDSQREALLYEILQALGGNPDEIMSKQWTAGNEGNSRPPYTSLTDALLYEIWMVIGDQTGGGGSSTTSIIYYGLIKDGGTIDPENGFGSKIVKSSSNYYIVPPAISNLSGNETDQVRLWIAEPTTEPVKTATLWLRNLATTFLNDEIATGALMEQETVGSYRVYVSEPMDAQLFNGQYIGPVFCSQYREQTVDFGTSGPTLYPIEVKIKLVGGEPGICSNAPETVWATDISIHNGVLIFMDSGGLNPYTGIAQIVEAGGGSVYNVDETGLVLNNTGDTC